MIYVGIVEDTLDPLKLARCKVRVFGIHDERLNKIKTEDLPWASVMMPTTGASLSGIGHSPSALIEGSMVIVMFVDTDKQQPIILGSVHGIPLDKGVFSKELTDDTVTLENSIISPESSSPLPPSEQTPPEEGKTTEQLEADLSDVNQIPTTPPAGSGGSKDGIAALLAECKSRGLNRRVTATILGICGGESRWKPLKEDFTYSKDRLIKVFPSIFANDESLAAKYANNPTELPEFLYGSNTAKGKGLGNESPGDGAKYIGRGFIQLTGKANYKRYGQLAGVDLVNNPDLLTTDPTVSAKVAVAYVLDRTKADQNSEGFFEAAKKAVGFNTPDIAAKKKSYYDYFMGGPQPPGQESAAEAAAANISQQPPSQFRLLADNLSVIQKGTSLGGLGFRDPSGKYPLYTKEQDTSRLSRNQKITETINKKKTDNRVTSIPRIYGEWEEQKPPYSAAYPHNKVYETTSGHVIEIDDSPGSERVHVYHKSGSYIEIDNTGSMSTRIVGSNYEIVDCNNHLYVAGQMHVTVSGSANLIVGGTLTANVNGSALVSVQEDAKVISSNAYIEATQDMHIKAGNSIKISSNVIHMRGKIINMDATPINQNTGAAINASPSGLSLPGESRETFIDDPKPNSSEREEELAFESEEDGDYTLYQKKLVEKGIATPEQLAAKPIEGEKMEQQKKTNDPLIPVNVDDINKLTEFPGDLKLSPNFTLSQVSSNAVVSKAKVVAQNGLSEQDIIANLQNLCLNVLEEVKRTYPNAFVTSGFRAGSGRSQHVKGEAVDLQFSGVNKSDYYQIAKVLSEKIPVFDQFLLEYKNYGTKNPWIHISCTRTTNRRQVLTFWNDNTYAQGLVDLATKS